MTDDLILRATEAAAAFSDALFSNASRIAPVYLLSTALIAAAVWAALRPRASLLAYLFPRRIWLHPSSLVDAQLWLLNRAAAAMGAFGTAATAVIVATLVLTALGGSGDAELGRSPLLGGLIVLLANEFAVYWVHRLHHERPLLWPFHAVHHSAEVMTPITVYRKHPVYDLLSAGARGAIYGIAQGVALSLVFNTASVVAIAGINAFYFVFNFLGANLRHSHVWLSYGPALEHVFISPAQHQIHHSRAVEHHDKNYGEVLAIWDWMFGTLYVPKGRERLRFGLAEADGTPIPQPHGTLRAALIGPFRDAAAALRGGAKTKEAEETGETGEAEETGEETRTGPAAAATRADTAAATASAPAPATAPAPALSSAPARGDAPPPPARPEDAAEGR